MIWPGCSIGHGSRIGDNCLFAPHVALRGEVGENCFLGINCSVESQVKIARDCVIAGGAFVLHDTEPSKVYGGVPAKPLKKSSYELFKMVGLGET